MFVEAAVSKLHIVGAMSYLMYRGVELRFSFVFKVWDGNILMWSEKSICGLMDHLLRAYGQQSQSESRRWIYGSMKARLKKWDLRQRRKDVKEMTDRISGGWEFQYVEAAARNPVAH